MLWRFHYNFYGFYAEKSNGQVDIQMNNGKITRNKEKLREKDSFIETLKSSNTNLTETIKENILQYVLWLSFIVKIQKT